MFRNIKIVKFFIYLIYNRLAISRAEDCSGYKLESQSDPLILKIG